MSRQPQALLAEINVRITSFSYFPIILKMLIDKMALQINIIANDWTTKSAIIFSHLIDNASVG